MNSMNEWNANDCQKFFLSIKNVGFPFFWAFFQRARFLKLSMIYMWSQTVTLNWNCCIIFFAIKILFDTLQLAASLASRT